MEKIVVAFGGSILAPAEPNPAFLDDVADLLAEVSRANAIGVVVGGGHPARTAIDAARAMGAEEEYLDRIGIAATRLNAQSLLAVLAIRGVQARPTPPSRIQSAADVVDQHGVVVMGGTTPGHSTDQVAVSLARRMKADRLVIASNVDGVYSADPNQDASAKRFETMTFQELHDVAGGEWEKAGQSGIVDGPAAKLLLEAQIPTTIVDGSDLDNLRKAIAGEPCKGTVVSA